MTYPFIVGILKYNKKTQISLKTYQHKQSYFAYINSFEMLVSLRDEMIVLLEDYLCSIIFNI